MDRAWGGNPFAGGSSFGAQEGQEADPFEESCDQVVYETDNKANLLSIYNRALQHNAIQSHQVLPAPSIARRTDTTPRPQQAWRPTVQASDGQLYSATPAQDAAGAACRPSQWTSLGTNPVRQSRRPSLDPVGSFDSPVGWDEGPQEEFEDLLRRPTHIPDVPYPTLQFEDTGRVPFLPQEQPGPVNEPASFQTEHPAAAEPPRPAEKGRSLLDVARDVWARPPSQFGQAARESRKGADDPFQEAGSLGLGWSQPVDKPARGRSRKERPKFSIRPQNRPSLTQAKSNIGLGLAPLAQRLKLLAESSAGGTAEKKFEPAHPAVRGGDTEQDDIEELEYHFEGNEAATCQYTAVASYRTVDAAVEVEEEIDEEEEESRSPVRQVEHPTALIQQPFPPAPTANAEVRTSFVPEATPAETSGRNLTSQFRNALQAATAEQPDGALADEMDWDKRQPADLLAQLQRARQRQQNQEMAFAKALQTGQLLDHDVRDCLDVRILETSLEAHLLKCRCEVLHEPEEPAANGGPADARVYVLVNRKTQHGELFESGRVVRIHPPWQTLRDGSQNRIVFNAICCQRLQ